MPASRAEPPAAATPEPHLDILIELLLELVFQLFGEVLVEWGLQRLAAPRPRDANVWLAVLGYLLLGALTGAASLWLWPHAFTRDGWPRLFSLVFTPVAAGLAMTLLGHWRARRGDPVLRIDRFAVGYLFALALAVVRFNFAT